MACLRGREVRASPGRAAGPPRCLRITVGRGRRSALSRRTGGPMLQAVADQDRHAVARTYSRMVRLPGQWEAFAAGR